MNKETKLKSTKEESNDEEYNKGDTKVDKDNEKQEGDPRYLKNRMSPTSLVKLIPKFTAQQKIAIEGIRFEGVLE